MEQRVPFVRVLKLSRLLETFFIASVTSVLVIRAFLASTGYPQLGGHGLHIAHLLWGGLLMLIALVLLLAFIGRHLQSLAALLGGIGFAGLFKSQQRTQQEANGLQRVSIKDAHLARDIGNP